MAAFGCFPDPNPNSKLYAQSGKIELFKANEPSPKHPKVDVRVPHQET